MDDVRSRFDLSGRVALVTGGSRGLGRAMVLGLAQAGADVVIVSRKAEACVAYAEEIHATTGRRALGLGGHVGDWDGLTDIVERVYDEFGNLDILVNNAGMSLPYGSLTDLSEGMWDKVMTVNLKGPARLAILAGERMQSAGRGSIINISSAASLRARPHTLPYAAAKAGLNAITVGLAHALGPKVRVNAVLAGTFLTDVSKAWDMVAFEERARGFALGRGAEPHEIVGTVVYLASDASSYTTGSLIAADGGQP
jgi:NAD(P)-dependent dehydrogenase (short-subunit alcohol dehydrogenase family)